MSGPSTDRIEPASAAGGLPSASPTEALQILLTGVVPQLVRGLFSPRPRALRVLTKLDADGRGVAVVARIRRKHPGQGVKLLGGRIVVLWGEEAIREVLDRSADVYASDSGAKGTGMSHFQPDALTMSRGETWRDRRAFNESVLATSQKAHPDAARFLAVVADEAARLGPRRELAWSDLEGLFDHVTLRVIFGDGSRDDQALSGRLERLMGEANRLVGLGPGDDLHEFYGALERKLRAPEPGSLIARFADAPQTDRTRVVHQIPHWMFATRDTLGANVARALIVIVADPTVGGRVREELEGADLTDPATVVGLPYLEGCLQETMRLWPTVPLLTRETTRRTTLAGEELDEGTQVLLLQAANHRNPDDVPDADRFVPERWMDMPGRDYRFNHLSNGAQSCPGGPLVSLLGKAILGQLLTRYRLDLREPHLQAGPRLPYGLDFFSLRLGAQPERAGAAAAAQGAPAP